MNNKYTPKKLGIMAVFIAVGLVLQYIESRILITPIPGGKLGLANIVSVLNIFVFGGKNAIIIASIRALLGSILAGSVAAIPYSVAGAVFSTFIMWLFQKFFYPKISIIGISVVGAVSHNIAQLAVVSLIYKSYYVFSYLPFLLLTALISGSITGYVTHLLANRVLKEHIA